MSNASGSSPEPDDELVMVALGGLGEIGMNVYLYGIGPADDRRWLMIDLGLTFPGESEPGVDVVLPDMKFIAEQRAQLDGIVITHAHEDHLGALIESWPMLRCPVYATPFTVGMLKAKLAEFGGDLTPDIREIPIDSKFKAGSFDLEFVSMSHSIPETSAVVMRTHLGTVFHTADWKLDAHGPAPSPSQLVQRLADMMTKWLTAWDNGRGFEAVRQAWLARAHPLGQALTVNTNERQLAGTFAGLAENGALLLATHAGETCRVEHGDVALAATIPVPERRHE